MHKIVNGERVEIEAEEEATIQAEWDKNLSDANEERRLNDYKRDRVSEYPSVGDQLDIILSQLKTLDTKTPEMELLLTVVDNIKTKYPKPDGV